MATAFTHDSERCSDGTLASLSKKERARMARNAAAATERLKAAGDYRTEVQDIRKRLRNREDAPA
ncbi:MAG TPA: hypothetical protein VHM92_09280 [Allosphingosinicella sp.]|nr:hypothetical protein [Allosphingosinicella sp.]